MLAWRSRATKVEWTLSSSELPTQAQGRAAPLAGCSEEPWSFWKKQTNKNTKQKASTKPNVRNGLSENAVWLCSSVSVTACGVTSQSSAAVLHISNKGRFLEEDGAALEMDNPFSKVIFKYRVIAVLHDKMHVPLCLIFELVRPFLKGHRALI